jgi:hypothetical protein
MQISNIQELKEYILNNELSGTDIDTLIKTTLGVYISQGYEKKYLMQMLESFIKKYPVKSDRPLFMDINNKDINVKDFVHSLFDHPAKNV